MLRRLPFLALLAAALALPSCAPSGGGASSGDVPLLLGGVPSDAVFVAISPRLDHALEASLDSASLLRSLDYGKLVRNAGAVALCDIGSIVPLALLDLGKHAPDTAAPVRTLVAGADSLKLYPEITEIDGHDVLLMTPSETVMTVVKRHLASESSILEAPYFDLVTEVLTHAGARIYRSRAAAKLPIPLAEGIERRKQLSFVAGASEWMVVSDGRLIPVQPAGGSYFCNYFAPVQEAPSRLKEVLPDKYDSVLDMPIGDGEEFRKGYEAWLDARVALEAYKSRITALRKSSGKSPLVWEKEARVQEVAVVCDGPARLNLVRAEDSAAGTGEIVPNPCAGYLNCLYGSIFEAADSCCMRVGDWTISGQRAALEAYTQPEGKGARWPARAKLVLESGGLRIIWTKEEIKIWEDSNR